MVKEKAGEFAQGALESAARLEPTSWDQDVSAAGSQFAEEAVPSMHAPPPSTAYHEDVVPTTFQAMDPRDFPNSMTRRIDIGQEPGLCSNSTDDPLSRCANSSFSMNDVTASEADRLAANATKSQESTPRRPKEFFEGQTTMKT